jgi:hypothetical protein
MAASDETAPGSSSGSVMRTKTVWLGASQRTSAPRLSATARSGTIVRPWITWVGTFERTVRDLIPRLKTANAQGIVEYPLNKIVM